MDPRKFFSELQRRDVYRVAVAYAVVSWLLIQIATQVFPFFDIPNWATRMVIVLLLLGFPVALVIGWIYELTPEGLQRTDEVAPGKSIAHRTAHKMNFVIGGLLILIISVMVWRHYRVGTSTPNAEKSVAVLPFLDLSSTKDQEYFSDGMTEQIINSLAHVHGLFVLARTTTFAFKNKNMDVREIGRQLHVTQVLEGSVSRGAGKTRIVAQLVEVANGYHIWSETYDSPEQDLLTLQSDVAKKVARALQIELHLTDATQLAKAPTHDPEAWDLYLRGRYSYYKRTVESVQEGLALFERAIARDPRFALAHAGVADSYIVLGKMGAIPGEEAARRAWPEVSAALSIDDQLAEGYVSRAILLTDFEWDWPTAEADFRKALQLNPNSAAAHHWYARHLAEIGRFEEALGEISAAAKQDPVVPGYRVTEGKILFVARQPTLAVQAGHKALQLEPEFASAFQLLGQVYSLQGDSGKAIEAAKKFVELSGGTGWAQLELAFAYAVAGEKAKLNPIVEEATTRPGQFSPYDMATICSALHDADGAVRWLHMAIDQRSVDVIWIRVDPRLDNVRKDSRFKELLARMVPRQPPQAPK